MDFNPLLLAAALIAVTVWHECGHLLAARPREGWRQFV